MERARLEGEGARHALEMRRPTVTPRRRMRIYAFDGSGFSTKLTPEEVFNADHPEIRGSTIVIKSLARSAIDFVHEEYLLTPDGAVKIK